MQLMSEPHNNRFHLPEAQAFYSGDSNQAPTYYSPNIASLATQAPGVHSAPQPEAYTSIANQQQQQQDLGTRVFGALPGCRPTSFPTSEIANQANTQTLATQQVQAFNSAPSDIPAFADDQDAEEHTDSDEDDDEEEGEKDDESSLASAGESSYQGRTSAYLGVKEEPEPEVLAGTTSSSNNYNSSTSISNFSVISGHSSNLRMNIQPSGFTKNHLLSNSSLSATDELSIKKRREDLSRRPSYRKIFNDLTGLSGPLDAPTPPGPPNVHMIANVGQLVPPTAASHRQSPHQTVTSSNQTPQAATSSPSPQALDLLSSVGMSTANAAGLQDPSLGASQSPVSVVDLQTTSGANQLAHQQLQATHQHQQQQHPHHHLPPQTIPHATNHHQQPQQQHVRLHQQQQHQHHQQHQHQHQQPHQHQQHQQQQQQQQHHHQQPLGPPPPHHHPQASQSHQAHLMLNTTTSPPISGKPGEEVNKKRELRLQKNREAAKECRRKKKEYIKCLENRVAVLENQNKALIDELKTLKDLYCKSTNE